MDARVVPPRHLVQLGQLEESFHNDAGQFMHIMTNGGGLRNMQLSECISRLQYLYVQIAAYLDAARDVNGDQITIETGRRALAMARSMVQHDQEETTEGA